MLKQGATCHWCGVDLVYIRVDSWPKGAMPDNFATVDHLYDRLTYPDREHTAPRHQEQTVLACHACNQRRNRERQVAIGAEQRAGKTRD